LINSISSIIACTSVFGQYIINITSGTKILKKWFKESKKAIKITNRWDLGRTTSTVLKPEGMAPSSSPKRLHTRAARVAKCETRRPKGTNGHEKQLDPRRSAGHTTPNICC
jgi:hypothetical protein